MAPSMLTTPRDGFVGNADDTNLKRVSPSPYRTSQTISKSTGTTDLLREMEEQLDAAAENYDNKFADLYQAMDEYNTLIEYGVSERKARTTKRLEQLREARDSAQLAEAEAADNRVVISLLERLDALEEKKHSVLISIDEIETNLARLQIESRTCKDTVNALSQRNSQLKDKWANAQPTLKFIRRLLKAVSNAALQTQSNTNIIQGFIGSEDGKAVIPFMVSAKNPTCEEIKAVWDIIATQVNFGPSSSPPTQ